MKKGEGNSKFCFGLSRGANILQVFFSWVELEILEKAEECDMKKMKTGGEVRSLLNAPQDPVRIGPKVRLT